MISTALVFAAALQGFGVDQPGVQSVSSALIGPARTQSDIERERKGLQAFLDWQRRVDRVRSSDGGVLTDGHRTQLKGDLTALSREYRLPVRFVDTQ